ncbi:HipA N-terminal domain-containing protein [Denitromonas ohlonensis]|uniref:HipA N-terminal domain-containing protein n=1 Tax=Denitromonas ohlonensis TaxID=3078508 RepID=UPI001C90022B|nr:HipA N-terminal domain-containing protein [Denitromonas ohlonensis]
MKLDVQVSGKTVAQRYRERDEYVLKYQTDTDPADFVSLTMPVRDETWRWPRDLHPFFRQNLPEGYLLNIIREEFGPLLDGTDLSLLAVVGASGIGRVTMTPEGGKPGVEMEPLQINDLLTADNTAGLHPKIVGLTRWRSFFTAVRSRGSAALHPTVRLASRPGSPGEFCRADYFFIRPSRT